MQCSNWVFDSSILGNTSLCWVKSLSCNFYPFILVPPWERHDNLTFSFTLPLLKYMEARSLCCYRLLFSFFSVEISQTLSNSSLASHLRLSLSWSLSLYVNVVSEINRVLIEYLCFCYCHHHYHELKYLKDSLLSWQVFTDSVVLQ